ncbi:MAG: Gx transporter family protein [Nitrospirota bacterium]
MMQLQDKGEIFWGSSLRETVYLSLLAAFAIVIHGMEIAIPSPIPWLRIGLANIITLTVLLIFGLKAAIYITLIRVIIGSFLSGTFLGPAFLLSFSGGVASTIAMGITQRIFGRIFSPVGISLIGASVHNVAQIAVVYLVLIRRKEVFLFLPVILFLAAITGIFNGIISSFLIGHLKKILNKSNLSL